VNEFLNLSRKRRNGEKEDCYRHGDERHEHQGYTQDSRDAVPLEPVNQRIENHRQEKNNGEKEENRPQRTKNRPSDNEEKDKQNDPPRPDVSERSVLVVGFCHGNSMD
jgi:predicted Fe-S protein YdhL (DUF1289 family)